MGHMKKYSDLIEEFEYKKIVIGICKYSIPCIEHEKFIKYVNTNFDDYKLCILENNSILPVEKRLTYLKILFQGESFTPVKKSNFIEFLNKSNHRYNVIDIVVPSDIASTVKEIIRKDYKKLSRFIKVNIIIYEGAPDKFSMALKKLALKGDFDKFKDYLPNNTREIEAKGMVNYIRSMGKLAAIKWDYKVDADVLREQYYNKEIFLIGEVVEANNELFEIIDRGSNYVMLVNSTGDISRRWLSELKVVSEEIWDNEDVQMGLELKFKGYLTKNFHHADWAQKYFYQIIRDFGVESPFVVLLSIKKADEYLGMPNQENSREICTKAIEWLFKI